MSADAKEAAFQQDIIDQMIEGGWRLGDAADYDRERALYPSDCLAYVKTTQPKTWAKYRKLYPSNPEQAFINKLAAQLGKAGMPFVAGRDGVDKLKVERQLRQVVGPRKGGLGLEQHAVDIGSGPRGANIVLPLVE